MLRVGLTGGIASGKSTVAELFSELDVPLIDSDVLAREAVEPGSPGLQALTSHFGQSVLLTDGSLNRDALRKIIFNDAAERQFVEDTLHPAIRELSDQQAQLHHNNGKTYCLFDIPLLVETKQQHRFERVLVVDVSEEIQATRVVARDNTTEVEAMKIINSQASRIERLNAATDIIFNDVMLDALAEEVGFLDYKFKSLAKQINDLGP